MSPQVENLLSSTSSEAFSVVARGALREPSATLIESPEFSEITASHNDARTIGIVKVSGRASVNGMQREWSSVVKIIDTTADSGTAALWVSPENEAKVYELGLLTNDGLPLRPATCYLAERRHDQFILLWLEDLTQTPQPPWALNHFVDAAKHIGQFNGFHAQNKTELPIEIGRDAFYERWSRPDRIDNYKHLIEVKNDKYVQAAWTYAPIESGLELAVLFVELLEKAKIMPHALAFGDSHSRNMFPVDSETVGIDWAGLSQDPIGVDAGVLAGSAFTFGIDESIQAAKNERMLFDSYISGLKSTGWHVDVDQLRLGYFAQFIGYFCTIGLAPVFLFEDESRRPFFEHRLGARLEEIPERLSAAMALFPKYVEEVKQLLG